MMNGIKINHKQNLTTLVDCSDNTDYWLMDAMAVGGVTANIC